MSQTWLLTVKLTVRCKQILLHFITCVDKLKETAKVSIFVVILPSVKIM